MSGLVRRQHRADADGAAVANAESEISMETEAREQPHGEKPTAALLMGELEQAQRQHLMKDRARAHLSRISHQLEDSHERSTRYLFQRILFVRRGHKV